MSDASVLFVVDKAVSSKKWSSGNGSSADVAEDEIILIDDDDDDDDDDVDDDVERDYFGIDSCAADVCIKPQGELLARAFLLQPTEVMAVLFTATSPSFFLT